MLESANTDKGEVTLIPNIPIDKNGGITPGISPIPAPRKINSTAGNSALLIFDFDQTITNEHMYKSFARLGKSDFNSDKENAVTEQEVKEFLQKENSGIKNEEKLKFVLKSALSSGVEVAIASFTKYIKAVEYVVKNHLDLTEEQAQGIKVVGKTDDSLEHKNPKIRKNLHILYLLKACKEAKGVLPKKVILVDDDDQNTDCVGKFHENIEELLKKDGDMQSVLKNIDQKIAEVGISEEELKNITFEGINVPRESITETNKTADDGYLDKVGKWINEPTHQNLQDIKSPSTFPTPPPSYKSKEDSEESSSLNSDIGSTTNKKTNRIWPRAKYAMQQKGFVIFSATAIVLSTSAALVYLQDKAKFIAFFANSPLYTIVPIIAGASLLAMSPMFLGIKQFVNTEEYQTQGKNADEILAEVLEYQPKDKAIKSVRLEYSNGTHSNFVLNAWEAKNDFINIDEKVVNRTNKIESVINNRPLFTTLLTGVGAASVALPLGLLATHGVNGVQKFYQNPLISNIGLSLLISSGILVLSMICLGVHYYRKTNCTNLIYSQEKIDPESVNKELIEEIKRERTSVLGENHSKDAKRISLTLERVVVQSHNRKDVVCSVS